MNSKSLSIILLITGIIAVGVCIWFSTIPSKTLFYRGETVTNSNFQFGIIGLGIIAAGCFIAVGYLTKKSEK